eukprot:Hpha_TRINITY_DN16042_c0_g2::TRINITY_DN16042_c0_g2_i2::g.118406::m.118406
MWQELRGIACAATATPTARCVAVHAVQSIFGEVRVAHATEFFAGEQGLCWDGDQHVRRHVVAALAVLLKNAIAAIQTEQLQPEGGRELLPQLQLAHRKIVNAVVELALRDPMPRVRKEAGTVAFDALRGTIAEAAPTQLITFLSYAARDKDRAVRMAALRYMTGLDPDVLCRSLEQRGVLRGIVALGLGHDSTRGTCERLVKSFVDVCGASEALPMLGYDCEPYLLEPLLARELMKLP